MELESHEQARCRVAASKPLPGLTGRLAATAVRPDWQVLEEHRGLQGFGSFPSLAQKSLECKDSGSVTLFFEKYKL